MRRGNKYLKLGRHEIILSKEDRKHFAFRLSITSQTYVDHSLHFINYTISNYQIDGSFRRLFDRLGIY